MSLITLEGTIQDIYGILYKLYKERSFNDHTLYINNVYHGYEDQVKYMIKVFRQLSDPGKYSEIKFRDDEDVLNKELIESNMIFIARNRPYRCPYYCLHDYTLYTIDNIDPPSQTYKFQIIDLLDHKSDKNQTIHIVPGKCSIYHPQQSIGSDGSPS